MGALVPDQVLLIAEWRPRHRQDLHGKHRAKALGEPPGHRDHEIGRGDHDGDGEVVGHDERDVTLQAVLGKKASATGCPGLGRPRTIQVSTWRRALNCSAEMRPRRTAG
jgi:hypothetical protein